MQASGLDRFDNSGQTFRAMAEHAIDTFLRQARQQIYQHKADQARREGDKIAETFWEAAADAAGKQ